MVVLVLSRLNDALSFERTLYLNLPHHQFKRPTTTTINMSSDEYDDIDEEDFLHAISQVSQPNPTSPRPAKRRRVSLQNDSISDSNSNPSSASHRKSSTSRKKRSLSIEADQSAGDASEKPAKEPKKKKPKHLIHIPKVHKEFKETYSYGTQADGEPGSSPYLARGAIWKIPRPPPGAETRQVKKL